MYPINLKAKRIFALTVSLCLNLGNGEQIDRFRNIKMNITIDQLNVIKFDNVQVRIITHLGEPWFIAVDVCNALEIKNVTNAIKQLNEYEKALYLIKGITRGNETVNAISESGFYKLIARSRKATKQDTFAYRFTNWVFGEVIPTIRKTGKYGVPWSFLNDYTKRQQQYCIEASKRGRDLEKCKREKESLKLEEKRLWNRFQPQLNFEVV